MLSDSARREWLADRQKGIGGTDIAAICGFGWRTPQQVYDEKTATEPTNDPGNGLMLMGLATENHNARLYTERTGARLVAPGLVRSEAHDWKLATLDRVRADSPDSTGRPVELKYTPFFGDEWGPDGTDQVREGYVIQATWQASILRANGHTVNGADVSAIDGYGHHRIYPLGYDPDLAALLHEIGAAFWERVRAGAGLEGWTPPNLEDVAGLASHIVPGTSIDFGPNETALVNEWERCKRSAKEFEEEAGRMRAGIIAALGGCEFGKLNDGRRVRHQVVTVNHKEQPARPAQPAYTTTREDVRILKASKPKKGTV